MLNFQEQQKHDHATNAENQQSPKEQVDQLESIITHTPERPSQQTSDGDKQYTKSADNQSIKKQFKAIISPKIDYSSHLPSKVRAGSESGQFSPLKYRTKVQNIDYMVSQNQMESRQVIINNDNNINIRQLIAQSNKGDVYLEDFNAGLSAMSEFEREQPLRLVQTNEKESTSAVDRRLKVFQKPLNTALPQIQNDQVRLNTANNFYRSHRHLSNLVQQNTIHLQSDMVSREPKIEAQSAYSYFPYKRERSDSHDVRVLPRRYVHNTNVKDKKFQSGEGFIPENELKVIGNTGQSFYSGPKSANIQQFRSTVPEYLRQNLSPNQHQIYRYKNHESKEITTGSKAKQSSTAQKLSHKSRMQSAGLTNRVLQPLSDLNRLAYGSYANLGSINATNPLQALQLQRLMSGNERQSQNIADNRSEISGMIAKSINHDAVAVKNEDKQYVPSLNGSVQDIESPEFRDYISSNFKIQQPTLNQVGLNLLKDTTHIYQHYCEKLIKQRHTETVYLNVYHVTSLNKAIELLGFGLYHTSIGIYGLEFSYGGHNEDCPGTVVVQQGNSAGLALKESIPIGITYFNLEEINNITNNFGLFWTGIQYDPFRQNCNNFTQAFVSYICDMGKFYYPNYINRFSKLGTLFRIWFQPLEKLLGNIVDYDAKPDFNRDFDPDFRNPSNTGWVYTPEIRPIDYEQQQQQIDQDFQQFQILRDKDRPSAPKSPSNQMLESFNQTEKNMPLQLRDAFELRENADQLYLQQQYEKAYEMYDVSLRMLQRYCEDQQTEEFVEPQLHMLVSMCECANIEGWYRQVVSCGVECLQMAQISRVYHLVGKALVAMEQFGEAYAYFEAAHRLDPSDEITDDFIYVAKVMSGSV